MLQKILLLAIISLATKSENSLDENQLIDFSSDYNFDVLTEDNFNLQCFCDPVIYYTHTVDVIGTTSGGLSPLKTVTTPWSTHTTRGEACACIRKDTKARVDITDIETTVGGKTLEVWNGVTTTQSLNATDDTACYGSGVWQNNVIIWTNCN